MDTEINGNNSDNTSKNTEKTSAAFTCLTCFLPPLPSHKKSVPYETSHSDHSETLGNRLEKIWKLEREGHQRPSLSKACLRAFKKEIFTVFFISFIQNVIIRVVQSILLGRIVECYLAETKIKRFELYLYATALVVLTLVFVIMFHSLKRLAVFYGMRMRIALCTVLYRKVLVLSKGSSQVSSAGSIVNLMSNDANTLDFALYFGHMVFINPVLIALSMYVLYSYINRMALVSFAIVILLAVPANFLSKLVKVLRKRSAHKTDHRMKLMNEIICGIKVIKMFAWEQPFAKLVEELRKSETKDNTKMLSLSSIGIMTFFIDRIPTFITLLIHWFLNTPIIANQIYVLATLTSTIQCFSSFFSFRGLSYLTEAKVSLSRMQEFLLQQEYSGYAFNNTVMSNESKPDISVINDIVFEHVTARWDLNHNANTLQDISLNIEKGKLYCITGPVGSGKSSLLQVILSELPVTSGVIKLNGSISFASQDPCLFIGTIRENILFGLPFKNEIYNNVIKVCALGRDFNDFPNGDKTNVNEKGLFFSGGQCARINLARAVYRDADIYILDDPLSSIDTRVGSLIFHQCILQYLAQKTRILITHQLQYLQKADTVIVLENGLIKAVGNMSQLAELGIDILDVLNGSEHIPDRLECGSYPIFKKISSEETPHCEKRNVVRSDSMNSEKSDNEISVSYNIHNKACMDSEVVQTEYSRLMIFLDYLRSAGKSVRIFSIILLLIITQMSLSGTDYMLRIWAEFQEKEHASKTVIMSNVTSESTFNMYSLNKIHIISIYGSLIIAFLMLSGIVVSSLYNFIEKASINLHNRMFKNLLYAKMDFFEKNNSGIILNRFSKDVGAMDHLLPKSMSEAIQLVLYCFFVCILTIITNIWMIIPLVIVCLLYIFFIKTYASAAADMKQEECRNCGPVFSHMATTLNGLETVRCFKECVSMKKKFEKLQDKHTYACIKLIYLNYSFGLWVDLLMAIYISILILIYILSPHGMSAADVGMGISQSLLLLSVIQYALLQTTEYINQLTSIERILEYTHIEKEEDILCNEVESIQYKWLEHGLIEYRNFYLRYNTGYPYVLKNINVILEPMQKIGIVGRTGAGKSSLINALFRMAYSEGFIIIDGVNIANIPLKQLRQKITIIPQVPFLFTASLRYNLDPFGNFSDDILISVLEEVKLQQILDLDFQIMKEGSNLSVGQRQLVCLARAILRNNKILVLDEATASVDKQTDLLIQDTIQRKFKHCTVITIAHRLSTIMDSDKVLVMDNGMVFEYDHPYILIQNRGMFYKMVKEAGAREMAQLSEIAKMAYNTKYHIGSKSTEIMSTKL